MGLPLNHPICRDFPKYKPSILGYPHAWKPPDHNQWTRNLRENPWNSGDFLMSQMTRTCPTCVSWIFQGRNSRPGYWQWDVCPTIVYHDVPIIYPILVGYSSKIVASEDIIGCTPTISPWCTPARYWPGEITQFNKVPVVTWPWHTHRNHRS